MCNFICIHTILFSLSSYKRDSPEFHGDGILNYYNSPLLVSYFTPLLLYIDVINPIGPQPFDTHVRIPAMHIQL